MVDSTIRRSIGTWYPGELAAAVSMLSAGAIAAFLLYRFIRRTPWPRPFRFRFVLVHVAAAVAFGACFIGLTIAIESLFAGGPLATRTVRRLVELPSEIPSITVLLYGIVLGIAYSVERRARIARIEADAVRAQLATLRGQLHPHFLFNALHAVVQLIPIDPARAVEAAELLASLLRTTVEEDRDEVALADEWGFVSRYLELERIRFGDRLRVRMEAEPELLEERVPSFALQTLVENAVRHGAAQRVAPTDVLVRAERSGAALTITVRNTGTSSTVEAAPNGARTGLSRLRERLAFLYGDAARLTSGAREDGDYEAALVLPRARSES